MNGGLEKELIERCRRGDKSAYGGLARAYAGRVFAICLGMLGNKEDAEDAAQEALLKGFSNIDELRDSERFGTWIAGIAKNLCVDHIRRRRRKRRFHRLWVTQPEASSSEYSGLEKALCELPEDYRVALMLYYFDGRSAKNIAEALDVSEATVCARLSRARNRLRELLDRQGDE